MMFEDLVAPHDPYQDPAYARQAGHIARGVEHRFRTTEDIEDFGLMTVQAAQKITNHEFQTIICVSKYGTNGGSPSDFAET